MRLILRWLCWKNRVCYKHRIRKTWYGWDRWYCEICLEEKRKKRRQQRELEEFLIGVESDQE